jgi:membrane-associated protease RseP (regulator of RpoE activity)
MSVRIVVGSAAIAVVAAILGGCAADDYAEFYKPNTSVTPEEIAQRRLTPAPAEPELVHGNNPDRDIAAALADGYLIIGASSFNRVEANDANAVAQAKTVGADRVLTFDGSARPAQIAGFVAAPTASTTSGADASGSAGTATALATTTSDGAQSGDAASAGGSDYLAVYLVKARFAFGASYRNLSGKEARTFGEGVMIVAVVRGTPAAQAGLLPGDAIVEANGQPVIDTRHLNDRLRNKEGRSISVTIVRGGAKMDKTVRLSAI